MTLEPEICKNGHQMGEETGSLQVGPLKESNLRPAILSFETLHFNKFPNDSDVTF